MGKGGIACDERERDVYARLHICLPACFLDVR
jgi:hypothetical protein